MAGATYSWMMNDYDDKLHALLRQWRDIEPAGSFEANVWRRIRQSARPEPVGWRDWLPQPAWGLAAAVIVGVVVGAGSGWLAAPVTPAAEQLGFLAPQTLTGALRR